MFNCGLCGGITIGGDGCGWCDTTAGSLYEIEPLDKNDEDGASRLLDADTKAEIGRFTSFYDARDRAKELWRECGGESAFPYVYREATLEEMKEGLSDLL